MNKLDITQVCILCTKSIADGRIGNFFTDRGIIPNAYTLNGTAIGFYYFSDGRSILRSKKLPEFKTVINPWKKVRRKFQREMFVSDDKVNWVRTIVLGTIKSVHGKYVSEIKTYAGKAVFAAWKYAKEID